MTRLLLRRLAASLLLLFLVLSVTFFLLHLAPGDPTALLQDSRIPQAQRERLRQVYGLDRPLPEQYFTWLRAVAVEGDWGISLSQQRPVTSLILEALPKTLLLAVAALAIDYGLGFLLGVAAARRPGSLADHLIRGSSLLLFSLPLFWLGLMAHPAVHLRLADPAAEPHALGGRRADGRRGAAARPARTTWSCRPACSAWPRPAAPPGSSATACSRS